MFEFAKLKGFWKRADAKRVISKQHVVLVNVCVECEMIDAVDLILFLVDLSTVCLCCLSSF